MYGIRRYFHERRWWAGCALVLAALGRIGGGAPPRATPEGLAAALGASIGGTVAATDIAWEPSQGSLADALLGRRLVFLGSAGASAERDVFRVWARVTREGRVVTISRPVNLTRTPLGDDAALEVRDARATFATIAYGRVQGVTVLELDGLRATDRPTTLGARLQAAINAWQRTASLAGVGWTDIVLDLPPAEVELVHEPPLLRVSFAADGRDLTFDTHSRELRGATGGDPYGARALVRRPAEKPPVIWLVDTVRAEVGAEPVAWAERLVFGAQDAVRRRTYALATPQEALREGVEPPATEVDVGDVWPPAALPSIWQAPQPGEGVWEPTVFPFLPQVLGGTTDAPPYFYRTYLRPDPKRPYSRLILIAIDTRQLELGMQAGYEDPAPLTGPAGTGRLPEDPAVRERVVATFNGAFKNDHGQYGMMVERRLLVQPIPGGATVVVDRRGRIGLGNWPERPEVPPEIVSFRQNLDPLVEDGVANPSGRHVWGWQLAGDGVMTHRSALCLTAAGQLLYAFGAELDAEILARGLRQAGCIYALHLDMNPGHTGFVYTDILDVEAHRYELRRADPAMQIAPDKYVSRSAKDFFYLLVRDLRPPPLAAAPWIALPSGQPAPVSLPAAFRTTLKLADVEVELLSLAADRYDWRIRAGTQEPKAPDAPPLRHELSTPERALARFAIGLGYTTRERALGLKFYAHPSIRLRPDQGTLVVPLEGVPRITTDSSALQASDEAVQAPLLAEDGELLPEAEQPGPYRLRAALGVSEDGRVVLALARHDSDAVLAVALVRAGCPRVIALDRGSQTAPTVHRAGTDTPPTASYEGSVLFALDRAMLPRAFRWRPLGSRASTHPTSRDVPRERKPPTAAPP